MAMNNEFPEQTDPLTPTAKSLHTLANPSEMLRGLQAVSHNA